LGSSGEGKTTLLRLILRLLHPDSGRIIIDDLDITDLPEEKLAPVRKNSASFFRMVRCLILLR
jgi:ABC-type sugar transport system ATPase subunit